eukprot:scaffold190858_cov41-Prasinocladus_malaysianus.AAC.1
MLLVVAMRYHEKEDDLSKSGNSARPSFSLSYIIDLSGSSDISQLHETPPLPFGNQHLQQTRAR